ncbi:MAG: hypothetical protein JRI52_10070, partial [Deltaproteobacteria bacterium]|nr:hypothetical protein [Deltaproteobacteria bacterium]
PQFLEKLGFFTDKKAREEYIKEGWFNFPKGYEKWFLADYAGSAISDEEVVNMGSYNNRRNLIADLLGICIFTTGFMPYPPINSISMMAELTSCATGMDIDEAGLIEIIRKVETLIRAYNSRGGLRRKDDTVPDPWRNFEIEPEEYEGFYTKLDRKRFDKWLDDYYAIRGWDKEGFPTKETFDKLNLNFAREELERRGILKK